MNGKQARTLQSKELESVIRQVIVDNEISYDWVPGFSSEELKRRFNTNVVISGCYPDGGIFLDKNGTPILAIEGKTNKETGNAIERWYKNYVILKKLNINKYITFTIGEGFYNYNSPYKILNHVHILEDLDGDDIYKDRSKWVSFYRYHNMEDFKENATEVISHILGKHVDN